jgi:hypothetical protein
MNRSINLYMGSRGRIDRPRIIVWSVALCGAVVLFAAVSSKADSISPFTSANVFSAPGASQSGPINSGNSQNTSTLVVEDDMSYVDNGTGSTSYTRTFTYAPTGLVSLNGSYNATASLNRILGYTGTEPTNFSASVTYEILSGLTVVDSVTASTSNLITTNTVNDASTLNTDFSTTGIQGAGELQATASQLWTGLSGNYSVEITGQVSYTDTTGNSASVYMAIPSSDDGGGVTAVPEPPVAFGLCTTLAGLGFVCLRPRRAKA